MTDRLIVIPDHARIDREVGARIRAHREKLALTQSQLGGLLGVSYQQVQKYEAGKNRVSASKLVAIAGAFNIPAARLLDGLGAEAMS